MTNINNKVNDLEVRLAKIETILPRLIRKTSAQTTKVITPSIPISYCTQGSDVRGPVLRYMFPCKGTVTKGLVWIKDYLPSGFRLEILVENAQGGNKKDYVIPKSFVVNVQMPVLAGDKLTISVTPLEKCITELWIAFLWVPQKDGIEMKRVENA